MPTGAFLTLDTAAGPSSTSIIVSGSKFLPGEPMTLYWDPPSTKVAGGATADSSGAFTIKVRTFTGDTVGLHHLCANVPPMPCAEFTLTAPIPTPPATTPLPSPSPSASASPSPTEAASASRLPDTTLTGLQLMTRPPFVFVPIGGVVLILLAAAYWVLVIFLRRPRPVHLPTAAIVHRATRPDYTAGFGAPPEPAAPEPPPSAWADVAPAAPAPQSPPPPPPPDAPPPQYPGGAEEPGSPPWPTEPPSPT